MMVYVPTRYQARKGFGRRFGVSSNHLLASLVALVAVLLGVVLGLGVGCPLLLQAIAITVECRT